MPILTATQHAPQAARTATVTARASFAAEQQMPPPTQAAEVEPEYLPDLAFHADQQMPAPVQRPRLVLARWRGPAEERPPSTPAVPRPY